MSTTEALALLTAELGHGTYVAGNGAGSTIFLGELPAEPDEAIAITPYAGPAGNAALPWDQPRYQWAVRGMGYVATETRAQAIYDSLVGLSYRQLGDAWLSLIYPVQSGPVHLPSTARGRVQFVINFGLHLHRAGPHRRVS